MYYCKIIPHGHSNGLTQNQAKQKLDYYTRKVCMPPITII